MARAAKPSSPVRSPCPVAGCLDLFGDRWTLLVIRDLLLGAERFKDFSNGPEHIPTNLLSDRLSRLIAAGVIETTMAADGSRHVAYRLTERGRALLPILEAMREWGLRWIPGTRAARRV